jgi:hypothetical protein
LPPTNKILFSFAVHRPQRLPKKIFFFRGSSSPAGFESRNYIVIVPVLSLPRKISITALPLSQ